MNEHLESSTTSPSTSMVNHDSIQENRYHICSIFHMIRCLAVKEMSLRGDKEITDEHFSRGKFLNLLEFVASKYERLAGIVETVPANATYSSQDIQNEIISIMNEMVRSKVVYEVHSSDGGCYTI